MRHSTQEKLNLRTQIFVRLALFCRHDIHATIAATRNATSAALATAIQERRQCSTSRLRGSAQPERPQSSTARLLGGCMPERLAKTLDFHVQSHPCARTVRKRNGHKRAPRTRHETMKTYCGVCVVLPRPGVQVHQDDTCSQGTQCEDRRDQSGAPIYDISGFCSGDRYRAIE